MNKRTQALKPFPAVLSCPLDRIEVGIQNDSGTLSLRFVAEGDVDRVAWPDAKTPGRANELWRHTCFEVFVATDDGYVEYNFSPSSQWAAYHFDTYRQGMRNADVRVVIVGVQGASDRLVLEARIDLPPKARNLALSAVIEDVDGQITYWALAHPSDKPDFHHPDSFVLELK